MRSLFLIQDYFGSEFCLLESAGLRVSGQHIRKSLISKNSPSTRCSSDIIVFGWNADVSIWKQDWFFSLFLIY
jgi:hypothetical protein